MQDITIEDLKTHTWHAHNKYGDAYMEIFEDHFI